MHNCDKTDFIMILQGNSPNSILYISIGLQKNIIKDCISLLSLYNTQEKLFKIKKNY